MGSFSGKLTIVQYQDQIGLADAGCSLGYQEGGGVSTKLVKGFRSAASVAKVKSTGTVIKDQKFWLFHKGTGNGKSLTLATGKIPPVLFQTEIQADRLFLYDFTSLSSGKCIPDFFVCGIFRPQFMLSRMVPWKSAAFEELHRFFPRRFLPGIGLYILTVEGNGSGGCVVKTGDQVHRVDLPLPVPPMIPIVEPFFTEK